MFLCLFKFKYERTRGGVRSEVGENRFYPQTKRMLSSVRLGKNNKYNISDLIQSIKGNFSRKIHIGSIWQHRFNTRIINNRKYL